MGGVVVQAGLVRLCAEHWFLCLPLMLRRKDKSLTPPKGLRTLNASGTCVHSKPVFA